ncbi:MAG: glycosyltransferase family 4 protein [Egibacteraceae bacterium]
MRVALVTESFLPQMNGVVNSVVQVVLHLRRRGCDVVLIAPRRGPSVFADVEVVRVPAMPLPWHRPFPLGLPCPLVERTIQAFRPDVVHVASPVVLGAEAIAVANRLGIPSVAVFQTDLPGFARHYRLRAASPALWAWLRRMHRRATLTLAPSSASLVQLRQHGIERVARWGRGVDLRAFDPSFRSETLRASLVGDGELLIGYVGRLAAEKRVGLLAHLRGIEGCRLVVVGAGPARARLQRALPEAAFLGFLTGPELSAAYASLDIFVHTGANETFCQAAQEAMASGVPVVAPASGGLLDLIEHGRSGWLWPAEDPTALREAVTLLAAEPARRALLGRRARESVAVRSWNALGDELLGHYRAAIDSVRPPTEEAAA